MDRHSTGCFNCPMKISSAKQLIRHDQNKAVARHYLTSFGCGLYFAGLDGDNRNAVRIGKTHCFFLIDEHCFACANRQHAA